jgi:hypothetical protein
MARRTPPRPMRGRNQMDVYWPRATGTTARDIIASSRVRMERRCGLPSMRRRIVRGRVMIDGIRWCSRWGVIVMGHRTLGRRRRGRRCLRSRVLSSHSEVPKLWLAEVYGWFLSKLKTAWINIVYYVFTKKFMVTLNTRYQFQVDTKAAIWWYQKWCCKPENIYTTPSQSLSCINSPGFWKWLSYKKYQVIGNAPHTPYEIWLVSHLWYLPCVWGRQAN